MAQARFTTEFTLLCPSCRERAVREYDEASKSRGLDCDSCRRARMRIVTIEGEERPPK